MSLTMKRSGVSLLSRLTQSSRSSLSHALTAAGSSALSLRVKINSRLEELTFLLRSQSPHLRANSPSEWIQGLHLNFVMQSLGMFFGGLWRILGET